MSTLQDFTDYIPFGSFSTNDIEKALYQSLDTAKHALAAVEASTNVTWESLQQSLYLPLYKLNQLWVITGHIESVNDTAELRALQEKFQSLISEFYVGLGQSKSLYHHFKHIKETEFHNLDVEAQKIINNEFRDFVLSGIDLPEEEQQKYKEIQNELSKTGTKFEQNLLDATDSYEKFVTLDELVGVPDDIVALYKQAAIDADKPDLYKITLHMPSYLPIMQYCASRSLRKELYYQYITRASEFGDPKFDNSNNICNILQSRAKKANLLKFNNFTELSLFTKMATNSEQVLDFLYQLSDKSKSHAKEDLADLVQFAKEHCEIETLEVWDVPYVSEKLQQHKYSYSNWELKQYFQLENVLDGLFKLIYDLYQVEFRINLNIPLWHADMCAYDVIKDNNVIGNIYLDLFARTGKQSGAWMNSFQDRFVSKVIHKNPTAGIMCNFTPPSTDKKIALLTFDEVQTLFHEMGHSLHHLLSNVNHCSISGINGVEWDAVELPSQFMEYFAWDKKILKSITKHIVTGESIPDDLYIKVLKARYYQSGLIMLRQLEFAIVDILLHRDKISTKEDYLNLADKVRSEVAVIQVPPYNRFLNSFSHIYAGGYAAGYYSYKWAEVLATDIFSKFDEVQNNSYKDLGTKFHNDILSKGGLNPMLDNFVAFMGREPKIDALLQYSGIN